MELPNLDCGLCGFKTCDELRGRLETNPDLLKRCIPLSNNTQRGEPSCATSCAQACCGTAEVRRPAASTVRLKGVDDKTKFTDSLGRDLDFYLVHFSTDPGPREIILPHNPMITREMDITPGDVCIGRPLGMSCGCPVTHCGVVTQVDRRTGVITWCVTGPLRPRAEGFKDLGYYIAEAYEGMVYETSKELKIGMRYWFMPTRCMLQWRHSGLINYLNVTPDGFQIRLEGLLIG